MAKTGTLNRNLYNIRHLYFDALWRYGKVDEKNKVLICDETATLWSACLKNNGIDQKGDCQLFNQTKKAIGHIKEDTGVSFFEDVFVNIDFTNVMKSKDLDKDFKGRLLYIENGIILTINGKEIRFVDFLKSNSMSKNNCIYYVNKEYKGYIEPRMTFGLDKKNMVLAKWYAYSGLSISDSTILEKIKLSSDEIMVVPDDEDNCKYIKCITAISRKYLVEVIQKFIKKLTSLKERIKDKGIQFSHLKTYIENMTNEDDMKLCYSLLNDIIPLTNEINAYYKSKDYETLLPTNSKYYTHEKHMMEIIERFVNATKMTLEECFKEVKLINSDYNRYEENQKEIYWKKVLVSNFPVFINKFDGEGLMSKEFCSSINNELNDLSLKSSLVFDNQYEEDAYTLNRKKYGFSFQIRLPFIKGVIHSCDLKKFFKKHNITKLYGLDFNSKNSLKEYDAKKVKIILTKSQFKAASFIDCIDRKENESPFDAFIRKMNEFDYAFAISNLEPNNKGIVKLNYQFFSTLPFSKKELDALLLDAKNMFKMKTTDDEIAKSLLLEHSEEYEVDDKIYEKHPEFYVSTKRFKSRKPKMVEDYKKELLQVKIPCKGYRKLICGDLLELLYHSCFHHLEAVNKPICEKLSMNQFYAPNTKIKVQDNFDKCILLRNPHYSRNEIGVLKPYDEEGEHKEFFGHLKGVLMINPFSLTAERLGGADYDGDTVVLLAADFRSKTINSLLNSNNSLKYPLIRIPSLLAEGTAYIHKTKVECLQNTFSSRVGIISDNALHYAFQSYALNKETDEDAMAFFTILNGLEIDSAKKGIKPYFNNNQKNKYVSSFLELKNSLKSSLKYKKILENICEQNLTINGQCGKNAKVNSPIHYVCNNVSHFQHGKVKYESVKLNNKNLNVDLDATINIISLLKAYNVISSAINSNSKLVYNKKTNTEKEKKISDNIDYIINKNDINNYEIVSSLRTDDPIYTFNQYHKSYEEYGYKYHYIKDRDERELFIENILNIRYLSEDEKDILCEFDNDKVYLLYLILRFWKEYALANNISKEYMPPKSLDDLTDEDLDFIYKKVLKVLNAEDLEKIKVLSNKYIDEVNKELVEIEYCKDYNKVLKKKMISILNKYSHQQSFEALLYVSNIDNSDIAFTLFADKLLKYLSDNKEVNHG